MNKLLSAIALSVSTMMLASTAMATPHAPQAPQTAVQQKHQNTAHKDKTPQKTPAPAQSKKVQKAVVKVGQKYPTEYRQSSHKVDFKQHKKLSKPAKNQQWYQVNQEFVLVNTTNQHVVKIVKK